ncbi:DDE-type integrase/transposase/recombinase [Paraburkholderia sp. CNPSo 3272]|uniref:DDE-type integrase/transposase/recombinase n=1 Tax=Paraburkholderia sp. CNPSo 3272 TaxID=2940931 RepID=UPI0020B79980|nr:DDE-type integrase/transposase/recombinase [Paraburkholderia sp. CNPSo 3272]MCP3722611.1 DDE-type integrase/transposase/recombinase [Paraburkholderia sp. CNPSo 3272]
MKRRVATESRNVEFPAVYRYDLDDVTRELYCQPEQVSIPTIIRRTFADGRSSEYIQDVPYTPDILRLTAAGPFVDEWKTEKLLQELATRYPWRYYKSESDNTWHCPEKEQFFAEMGITFCLRSSVEHNPVFITNLQHLRDFLGEGSEPLSEYAFNAIKSLVEKPGALSLAALCEKAFDDVTPWNEPVIAPTPQGKFRVDDVWKAIAEQRLHVDLDFDDLSEPHDVAVCSSREQLELVKWNRPPLHAVAEAFTFDVEVGSDFMFRGTPEVFTISGMPTGKVLYYSDSSVTLAAEMPELQFQSALYSGDIIMLSTPKSTEELLAQHEHYEDGRIKQARDRFLLLEALEHAPRGTQVAVGVGIRQVQRLKKKMREAGDSAPLQMLALIRRRPPGRGRQISEAKLDVIREIARRHNNPTNPLISNAYEDCKTLCAERGIEFPPSKNTFYRHYRAFFDIRSREGSRRAYNAEPIVWYLNHEDKVHGGRPFHRVHIDHTKLDIIIYIRGYGGRVYRIRPWLTIIMDATSRAVLAFYLAAHAPSATSCMMAIREMIRLHRRMPEFIVVDGGKDLQSLAFESLCHLYDVTRETRPYHEARFGAVIERLFGITNQLLIYKLVGNTKAMKHVRTVTRQVDPARADHMSFAQLHGLLEDFFYVRYNRERVHPAHDHTPEDYMNKGFIQTGRRLRRLCPFNRRFMIQTCIPVSRGGTRTVDPQRGIQIGPLHYWTDEFSRLRSRERNVPVLVDMWDVSVAWASIRGRWVRCESKLLMQYRRLTAIELRYAFYEVWLRLRKAPEESFESLLDDVLNDHVLPAVADATAATHRIYGAVGIADVIPRETDGETLKGDDKSASAQTGTEQAPTTVDRPPSKPQPASNTSNAGESLVQKFNLDYESLPVYRPL